MTTRIANRLLDISNETLEEMYESIAEYLAVYHPDDKDWGDLDRNIRNLKDGVKARARVLIYEDVINPKTDEIRNRAEDTILLFDILGPLELLRDSTSKALDLWIYRGFKGSDGE